MYVMYYSTGEISAFKLCVFIGLARIDKAVKLSQHMFINGMYVLKGFKLTMLRIHLKHSSNE